MKTQKLVILIILIIGLASCEGDENINIDSGINFRDNKKVSEVIVKYNDIVGYDSTKYIFCIAESSWNRLKSKISPMYPNPHFGFSVRLHKLIIYNTIYIPFYYSRSYDDIITFRLAEPNLVYITLGYPPSNLFTGKDDRNDSRLINQLKKDNKLLEIED